MSTLKSTVKIDGESRIYEKLKDFIIDVNSSAADILTEGAKIIKTAAVDKAPVSKYGLKKGKYAHPPGTLKKSIDIGVVYRTKASVSMAVGIEKNQYFTQGNQNQWYARWIELGTKERIVKNYWGHKGVRKNVGAVLMQPFMRPALKRNRSKIRSLVYTRLKEELF